MKKGIVLQFAFTAIFSLFISCQKSRDTIDFFRNPLEGGCQVAEYHIVFADDPVRVVFPFKKTFDASGKIVKEIECVFWPEIGPSSVTGPLFHFNFKIEQHGLMIFFINKEITNDGIPDTVVKVTLNNEGRPRFSI